MKKNYILIFLLALSVFSEAQISKGKNFWFAFMQNYDVNGDSVIVYITADASTTGVLSIPGQGVSIPFAVTPGVSTKIALDPTTAEDATTDQLTGQGVHVVTQQCVSVFAYNGGPATADAAIIYPINSIGLDYLVNTYQEAFNLGVADAQVAEFIVVGNYPGTIVNITPSVTTGAHPAGVTYSVTLDSGQTYLLQNAGADLTGTRIVSANGTFFSVFAGNTCANVNNMCCCDHLYEQTVPTANLGNEYITIPYQVPQPDKFRILAIQNGTNVLKNGVALTTLNAGQYYDYNSTTVDYITSNNNISMMQMMGSSQSGGGANDLGDPLMIAVSANSQRINTITFPTMTFITPATNYFWYVNLAVITQDIPNITLDGAALPAGTFTPVPANNTYSSAHIRLGAGDHHVNSQQGVIGYVIGYSDAYESFGYLAGVLVEIPHLSIYDSTKAYCPNDTVNIALNSPDTVKIVSDEWDLGDGSPHLFDTLHFQHVYTNYGEYPVTLIYLLEGACEPDTTVIDTIKILGPAPDIGGPFEFCVPGPITIRETSRVIPDTLFWTVGTSTFYTLYPDDSISFFANQDTVVKIKITSNICPGYDTANVYVAHDSASFTFTNACTGIPVAFTNTSQIATGLTYNWLWNFGDGNTSIVKSPTYQYTTGGTYTVTLKLISPAGCTSTFSQQVTIYAKPVVSFVANNICKDSVLTPINTSTISTGSMTYSWNFGDGSAIDTSTNPSHTYHQSAAYNVSLVATSGPGCSDSVNQLTNDILPAHLQFTGTSVCLGQPSTFTDLTTINTGSAILDYKWNFGDGDTSIQENTTYTYADTGNYTVSFIVDYGSSCYDTLQHALVINPVPVAAFTVSDLCNTGTVTPVNTTTDTSGTMAYSWDFGDNTGPVSGQSPSHTYAQSGAYTIQLIASSNSSCSDTATNPINVIRGTLINFSAPSVCAGLSSNFTDQTTNPYNTTITGYTWSFGDGATATQQNTTHAYATFGSYNVQLLLTYNNNCADSLTKVVTVNENPVAAFTVSDLCNDSVARPQNSSTISTGGLTYSWNFGDNSAAQTQQNATHTYTLSGTYNIQLVAISDSLCSDTVTNPINVIENTFIDFFAQPVCIGFATTFINQTANPHQTTITGYNWNFGDGNTSTQQSATHTYAAAGTYNVQLLLNYSATCADSFTKPVVVNPAPVAGFTVTTPCIGNASQFTDASTPVGQVTAFNWLFGDGGVSTAQNPAHLYSSAGIYNVQLIAINTNGCQDTLVKQDTVLGKGGAQFTAPDVCLNDSTLFTNTTTNTATYPVNTYLWTFGDGVGTSVQTNPTYLYNSSGNFNVTLVADFTDGCADTVAKSVTIYVLPTVSSAIINASCFDGTDGAIQLTPVVGAPPFNYQWSNNETGATDEHLALGAYTVTFTDAHQCTASASYSITQPTLLWVDTATSPIICFGYTDGSIQVTVSGATPPYTYTWSTGDNNNGINNLGPGIYSVTVTDSSGCSVSKTVLITEPLPYTLQTDSVLSINLGQSIQLNVTALNGNPSTWSWSPDEFINCDDCQSPLAQPVTTLTYTVQSTSDKGCEAEGQVLITVVPTYTVYIPNVFSPNGDGNDDYFQIFGNKEIWKQCDVKIFDRWGEKVFESSDMNFKWDGSYKGKVLLPAVFVYEIHIVYIDDHTDKLYKGSVTLLR